MARALPGITVVGGAAEGVAACTRTVVHKDTLQLGDLTIKCLHTPLYVNKPYNTQPITQSTPPSQSYAGAHVLFLHGTKCRAACGVYRRCAVCGGLWTELWGRLCADAGEPWCVGAFAA